MVREEVSAADLIGGDFFLLSDECMPARFLSMSSSISLLCCFLLRYCCCQAPTMMLFLPLNVDLLGVDGEEIMATVLLNVISTEVSSQSMTVYACPASGITMSSCPNNVWGKGNQSNFLKSGHVQDALRAILPANHGHWGKPSVVEVVEHVRELLLKNGNLARDQAIGISNK